MSELSNYAMSLILEDRIDEAKECLLAESIESDIIQSVGEVSALDYLLKLEKFFDQRDLYLFRGWQDAQVLSRPKVDRFWDARFACREEYRTEGCVALLLE
jgi:hypothetical protein